MIPPSSSGKVSPASIAARLRNIARERNLSVESVRDHYIREGFLRRLQSSPHADDFILKGSVLLLAWFGEFHRPTLDADFLVRRPMTTDQLRAVLIAIACVPMDDHIVFHVDEIRMEEMQEDRTMVGQRISIPGHLGSGGLLFRADIGFSDVVTPGPGPVKFQGIMTGSITMLGSTLATVIAEKYDAMVDRGATNTRVKDYFDLATIARRQQIVGQDLVAAIRATFTNRGRRLPIAWDSRLDDLPANSRQQQLWANFLREIGQADFGTLEETISTIKTLMTTPLRYVPLDQNCPNLWQPGRGWETDKQEELSALPR
jgi:hypothetical protein